jgi:iron(III) transport system ATP-binding protein
VRVSIRHLSKSFGTTPALQDVSLEIESQELFFLLGPSGCGKTTLLRAIAGFCRPDAGEICFGDARMDDVAPHRRNTGMVFQNYALWPHLSVADNVAYGLEVRRIPAAARQTRVAEALALVQMENLAERLPNQLSGGQQQRVALARALVVRPDVLLLDEPLSNLDARLRLELREEIRRIHAQTRITTIYVTHDQKEALSLARRLAVFREGRVEQIGAPRAVYCQPANRFVADFIGETNWWEASVVGGEPGELRLHTALAPVQVASELQPPPGTGVWLGFRPEAVELGPAAINSFPGCVAQVSYQGEIEQYCLRLSSGETVKACALNPRVPRGEGDALCFHVEPQNFLVMPR